ncbi:MAG: pyruvate dehydrogenase complex dihydrolipoamide acetyltransferase [Bacteroidota bacterium]
MAEVIKMPKMSDTMEEGVIASWLKKEGDEVKSGDVLAEVETDKATMELESYDDGVLLHIGVNEKDSVPVDGVIAIIGEKGENIDDLLKEIASGGGSADAAPKAEAEAAPVSATAPAEKIDTSNINAQVITMPKMSDTMEEGTIAQWLKKVGDAVKSGDILAEVETDKATMELESYDDGELLYTAVGDGESVAVDGVIAIIGEKGADYETLLKAHAADEAPEAPAATPVPEAAPAPTPAPAASAAPQATAAPVATSSNGRVIASPLAKKLAAEKGFDIAQIPGSGEGGRIIKRDVESFTPQVVVPAASSGDSAPAPIALPSIVGEESFEEAPVSQMRKAITKTLSDSKFSAPHFYVTMEIDMDRTIVARKSINEISPVKISFNDIVIKACATALRQHPTINSSWLGDKIRTNKHVHMGVAVAVDEGLLVPVVRFADNKPLSHFATEVKDLAGKAKSKKLQPADWEGSTFTISNLGMFGVEEFTAIINPPNSCILAVGGIKQTAVVKDGQLVPGNVMKVTLSCDHRVVDGASGAAFLQTLKGLLEDPVRILV